SLLRFCQSFSGDALFAMLKTGISDLSVEEISELENYVFIWNISGKRWFEEFTLNPDGFQEEFSDGQKERLVEVNRIRKKAIVPVQKVISRLKSIKTGEEISACIYEYLENNEIPKNLAAAASDDAEAEIFSQVWDCLMGILDQLAVSVSGRRIDLPKYISLFELVVASKTIGSIPQRIDEVNVGNAERMRPASPKVVFIVGANDRIFPKIPSAGGLLTDSDRSELIKNGVKIKDGGENEMIRERALAYNAVCAASDMLFVTWSESDSSGTALYPSQIVTDILKIFPKIRVYREKAYLEKEDRECLEPIASPLPALEAEALCGGKSTVFSDSLRTALLQLDETSETLKRIEEFSKLLPETVSREHAKELFGGDRQLSPTSIERFFRCPFRYFCMYGMKAKARCTTEMDNKNRGTLVHYCLEQLITKFGSDGLKSMTERDIQQQVTVLLQKYLDTALGGEENKTSRFKRNYMMTSQLIKKLAVMIAGEFSEGNFRAAYCELEIGNSMSSKVRPIEIRTEDQSVISVTGFIDRVDTCDCGGKTLIRVIDYKTGRKSLDATDLYNGLNLQMPLYLFTLCRNGEELFSGERIPAAVLYVRAADKIINTLRSEDDSSLEEKFRKEMKFNGIVLNDEDVIDSIDESRSGKYLKLKYSEKDGKISGGSCTVSYEEMKGIEKRIEELLIEMNRELKNGNIGADPVDDSENGCKYCDYESVCKKQRGDPHRKAVKVKGFDFKNGGNSDE
ncbi:MAG: PD-(D/E)XK nuclease family protein, partial [Acutalibacteraceae bacterium]